MADLSGLRTRIKARAVFAVSDSSRRLQATLKTTSPRVTGTMQNRTSVTADGLTATARAATEYASFVKDGTRPHVIRPRRARVLSFFWPQAGGRVFLAKVNHPGARANGWWDKGIGQWPDFLRDSLKRAPN